MRRICGALITCIALAAIAPTTALARKKKKEPPPPIEFTILRDGAPSGTFSYTEATFSGKYFTSSKLEMKTKRGTVAIMTHVEKDGAGKLLKYRKWVGNEGAKPDVIAFWKGPSLRVVSKLKGKRFTRDLAPAKGFQVLDQLGFHLYGDLIGPWESNEVEGFEAVTIHKGRLDKVTLAAAGVAILKDSAGKEVMAEAVSLKSKSFNLIFFIGEKQRYLGFKSKRMVLIRKGWNLLRIDENATTKPEGPLAEEKPAEKKPAEEKLAEEKLAEEKLAEEKLAEEKLAEEKPAEEKPAEEKPAEEKPAEEKPAEEKPAEEKPAEEKPAEEKKALPPLPE
jgi:hypothetical protein